MSFISDKDGAFDLYTCQVGTGGFFDPAKSKWEIKPSDSVDTHIPMDAIYRDLEHRHPGRITERGLAGLSLGR